MQRENSRDGFVQRLARRLRGSDAPTSTGGPVVDAPGSVEELRALRGQIDRVKQEVERAEQEREQLKAERLRLQEVLGAQHGKRVLPRLKVEKTNGVPSLVAGARMMHRVHARAEDPRAGIDGAGALFADVHRTESFVRSHGVQTLVDLTLEPHVIVHAFKGRTPLIEVRAGSRVKHVATGGKDLGDIRPGVPYDPEIPVPEWLGEVVRASQTLSAHISRPYAQIGWRDHEGRPALTGVEVSPARIPVFNEEWDQKLGKAFDSGHARMLMQPYGVGALANRVPGGTFQYEETV